MKSRKSHKNTAAQPKASEKTFSSKRRKREDDEEPEVTEAATQIGGWQRLRNRLKAGTLMPALREIAKRPSHHLSKLKGKSKFGDKAGEPVKNKFNVTMLILEAKSRHDVFKKKQKERAERRRLLKKQKKLEKQLEYLNFPTIMGWYFDGFFTPYFQLKEDYANIFNELERVIAQKKEKAYKETFQEKAKRNFWPPVLIAKRFFRTKGVYLDFKEILKDPPHTPPDIITDPRTKAVTLFVQDKEDEESKMGSMASTTGAHGGGGETIKTFTVNQFEGRDKYGISQMSMNKQGHLNYNSRHEFYFDDKVPGFFKKVPGHQKRYFYDSANEIWRLKREPATFPHDFYFDDHNAVFKPKDRTRQKDDYLYCADDGVYRMVGNTGGPPSWRNITPKDFFWDEVSSRWKRKGEVPKSLNITFDENANRFCHKVLTQKTPDDFYFDTFTLSYVEKEPSKDNQYLYDPNLGAWRRVGEPSIPRGVRNTNDYYWNENKFCFKKKDAPGAFFILDNNNKFFRKKKPTWGRFHPKNWTWNKQAKVWEPKKTNKYNFVTQSSYWRPDRDYDKPWLDYEGGLEKYHLYWPDSDEDEDETESIKQKIRTGGPDGKGLPNRTVSTPLFLKKGPQVWTGPKVKGKGPEVLEEAPKENKPAQLVDKDGHPVTDNVSEAIRITELYEDKVLKLTNLGTVVTDMDIKGYFASVVKVKRPEIPGSKTPADYAYLYFYTEEAAAAAFRTMHNRVIKGQTLKLQFMLKDENTDHAERQDLKQSKSKKKK